MLAFLGTMLLGALILPNVSAHLHLPWMQYPIVIVAGATAVAAVFLETAVHRASECPWIPLGLGARVALYGVTFLVGMLVIYPAVDLSGDVLLPFRAIGIICLVSVIAYLGFHLRLHKQPKGNGAAGWILLAVARVPFLLLCALVLLIIVAGIAEIITAHR